MPVLSSQTVTRPPGWSAKTIVAHAADWAESSNDKGDHGYNFHAFTLSVKSRWQNVLFYQAVPVFPLIKVILLELKLS